MRDPDSQRRSDSLTKGAQGIDDGTLDNYIIRSAIESATRQPKRYRTKRPKPILSPVTKIAFLLFIGVIAYLGYKFGRMTATSAASSRPEFFALVGTYAAILLLVWYRGGIITALVIAGMAELIVQLYLGGSPHRYIISTF